MSNKLADIERRRESLILRSGGQRERLAESCERLARTLQWSHLLKAVFDKVKSNPGALMGVTAFLGGRRTKFRRLSNWLSVGWSVFRAVRTHRARRRE